MDKQPNQSIYYPDIRIFLVAIPLISAFNYYLTYVNIRFNGFLLLTYTIDTLQGYLAWWAVRAIILKLDEKLPYAPNLPRRMGIQVLATTLAGMGIIVLLTELVSWVARGRPAHISFYSADIFIIFIWFLVMNGVYTGLYFYRQWQQAEKEKQAGMPLAEGVVVKTGTASLLLKWEEILFCFVEGEYVKLHTAAGKNFYTELSLNRLEEKLPPSLFFRLNRQCILHRQAISGFRRIEHGKLEVQLQNPVQLPLELTISRTKAGAFKGWFLPA